MMIKLGLEPFQVMYFSMLVKADVEQSMMMYIWWILAPYAMKWGTYRKNYHKMKLQIKCMDDTVLGESSGNVLHLSLIWLGKLGKRDWNHPLCSRF